MREELRGRAIANGRYVLLERVAKGCFTELYSARDEGLGRVVAIKLFYPDLVPDGMRPELVKRFENEARVLAHLHHSHICPIYDFGLEDDFYYLVMMYAEGGSLADRIAQCREHGQYLSLDFVLKVTQAIGEALDYAHRRGVLHRDIKPSNILIAGEDEVFLSDFGLARMPEQTGRITAEAVFLGSWVYAAPEQIAGEKVTERCDVYSLGVTLYEMLTGEAPFLLKRDDVPEKALTKGLPVSPSVLRRDLPKEVDDVILKALDTDPERRFRTAGDFVRAFRISIIGGGNVREQEREKPPGKEESREEPSVWVTAAVVLLGLTSCLIAYLTASTSVLHPTPTPIPTPVFPTISFESPCPQWERNLDAVSARCESGKYIVLLGREATADQLFPLVDDCNYTDFNAQVEVEMPQPQVGLGLLFWQSEQVYYTFSIEPAAQKAALERVVAGQRETLNQGRIEGISLAQGTTLTLRVIASGLLVNGYVNDVAVVSAVVDPRGQGYLGLVAFAPAGDDVEVHFDNLTVSPISGASP